MALRKSLVLIAGEVSQLPAGDVLATKGDTQVVDLGVVQYIPDKQKYFNPGTLRIHGTIRSGGTVQLGNTPYRFANEALLKLIDTVYTATERLKLAGIEFQATKNLLDSFLLSRRNQTGTQLLNTISDAGTAAALDIAPTGNASTSQVVKGTDTRLTDARNPLAHGHTAASISGLVATVLALPEISGLGTASTKTAALAGVAASPSEVVLGSDPRLVPHTRAWVNHSRATNTTIVPSTLVDTEVLFSYRVNALQAGSSAQLVVLVYMGASVSKPYIKTIVTIRSSVYADTLIFTVPKGISYSIATLYSYTVYIESWMELQ